MSTDINGAEVFMLFGERVHPQIAVPAFEAMRIGPGTAPELARFLEQHITTPTTSAAAVFVGEKTPDEDALVQSMVAHYHRAATQINTLATQAEFGFNIVRTLQRNPAWACQHGLPFVGQRVFVVGAGASLDDFADVLPELAKRGHVLTSNSGLGALQRAGVTPDAVTYCERMHLQHHLAGYEGAVVLDARASQQAWDAAKHPLCCLQTDPDLSGYMRALRVAPLKYEVSAFNCAVAQAFAWGAQEIVILGASFCMFPGAAYAKGSAHEHVVEAVGDDGRVVERGKTGVQAERSATVLELRAIGGGTVASPAYFADEIASLSAMACRVQIRNLNMRGVDIPNTTAIGLEEVLAMPVMAERHDFTAPMPGVDASVVLREIEAACRGFLEVQSPSPRPGLLRFFARRALMMQSAAANWEERKRTLVNAIALGAVGTLEVLGWPPLPLDSAERSG